MCTLLDLMLNQTNKIGVYIISAILISFCSNKIGVYIIRQIKKLTWLQTCFLGDVEVIWCNSFSDSLFQILCDKFCKNCDWFLFTYHLTCISSFWKLHTLHMLLFAKLCTCYCVWFWFGQPSLKIPFILCKMCLKPENLRRIGWTS